PSGEHSLVIKARHNASVEQDEKRFWSPPLPVIRPPTVSIVRPGPTDQIRDIVSVQADITPEKGLSKVRYYVDAALKEEKTSPPFGEFNWDTKGLPGGLHILRVEAVHINGQVGSAETTVKLDAPPPAPVAAETKEADNGISPVIYAVIVLLLVAIAIAVFCLLRRRKGAASSGVQTMPREAAPVTQAGRTKMRPVTPDFAADEKTTMDIQETLEPLAKLTVLKSNKLDLGATFKVMGTTEIGRGTENKIRIPDKPVSRKHAVIYCTNNQFFIRDLNSSFGTRVDGKDVTSTGSSLYDGAKIELGSKTIMEFNILVFGKGKEGSTDDKTLLYKP
ncbi:MAG: FHA domain-containing protein, partial [Deltaproteobacteria bacterium]|nr:FHA domain-containing protein [Deltaproteobacteria bacterium]